MNPSNAFSFQQDLFDFPCTNFKKHLLLESNNRIIFSGKFGIGKSFFLNHFFKDKIQTQTFGNIKYRTFHIYPVNYSIASNEDVFRYIKYDIITLMLLRKIEVKEKDLSYLDTLPRYLKGNLLKVLATLIYMIPKIGKDVYESYEKLEELKNDFLKHHEEANDSEGDKLIEFLEKIENKEGSIFDNDIITKLIANILNRLKSESGQENVLIIDDLDRIDPEHIFRLLNIFAAHLDNPQSLPNKLGFDKIILVCDINNLRNIFKSKYGTQTDFNGYIDKFYSSDIYHFDNREILSKISYEAFKSVSFADISDQNIAYYKSQFFRRNNLALELLQILISYSFISLRSLITRLTHKVELNSTKILKFDDISNVYQLEQSVLVHFKILKEIAGGYDALRDYVNRIPLTGFILQDINSYSNILLFFVHYDKTFRVTGNASIDLNGRNYYLTLSGNKIESKLQNLILYSSSMGVSSNPVQHNYSIKEFLIVFNDFIELLKRIEN